MCLQFCVQQFSASLSFSSRSSMYASNSTRIRADPITGFPQIAMDNTLGAWLLGVALSLL